MMTPRGELSILRGADRPIADPSLLAGFSHQVRDKGGRAAVIDSEGEWTYAELDKRSSQLAAWLRRKGVGPKIYVGVAMPRSRWLIMALLAVVKAGGAYVPLDPDYPAARLARMQAIAQPKVVLTLRSLAGRFPQAVCVDSDFPKDECEAPISAGPEDPLYVIFTSGSTGDPKGAVVSRRGFANLIEWFQTEFALGPEDRFLLISSPSFDLTQKNFFAALQVGGTLVCYPSGPYDLARLAGMIEQYRITALNGTPSAFYPLVEDPSTRGKLASLRLAVLGGEPISIPRVRSWLEETPEQRAEIANTYGPTECTDICGYYRLSRQNIDRFPLVPLGGPIPNVQLAVVDEQSQPVPAGETGELIIGGAGVGLGYLGDQERTAASFVPNPLPQLLDGPLVYHTGDRVRLLAEGVLEFLGRADHQVKVRGFRIELSEVELALGSHPTVREAVVLPDATRETLQAFIVPREATIESNDLRAFLAERLPAYMVPAEFREMEEFPLTPNGKVDRLKLAQEIQPVSAPASLAFQGNALETNLHRLWRAALGREAIGLDDNFFDLGGNSIQLAVVHARVMDLVNQPLPITDLFAHPTIRSLARHLGGESNNPRTEAVRERAEKQRQALAARRATRA